MIVNDESAISRLNSPMNLINRLRESKNNKKNEAMAIFGINRNREEKKKPQSAEKVSFNPFQNPSSEPLQVSSIAAASETSLDNILENHDSQIKLGLAHDSALKLLNASITQLAEKLDDVRADRLPSVIAAASKTVESIRRERAESAKQGKDREVHYHFYTPEQKTISQYEVIDVA